MEKVSQIPASPMDFILFPVWLHKKISFRFPGLLIAFAFVGCFDMFFFDNLFKLPVFSGNIGVLFFRLVFFVLLSLLVGAIDVVCTIYPIADFAQMIGKRSEKYVHKKIAIILMKSYAISHVLSIIPFALAAYSGFDWNQISPVSTGQARMLFAILGTLMPILPLLQLGVLYRTISIRTKIQAFGKLILILAVYFWIGISGNAVVFVEEIAYSVLKSM